jgi:hypothetical protein
MRFDFEHEPISSATKPMFYGWTKSSSHHYLINQQSRENLVESISHLPESRSHLLKSISFLAKSSNHLDDI